MDKRKVYIAGVLDLAESLRRRGYAVFHKPREIQWRDELDYVVSQGYDLLLFYDAYDPSIVEKVFQDPRMNGIPFLAFQMGEDFLDERVFDFSRAGLEKFFKVLEEKFPPEIE